MVVGHSAASSLAWLAVDARPGKVGKTAFIGGWPAPDGKPYFDGLPVKDGAVPFPGWDEFEGPDSADLDDAARRAFAAAAIPVPEGVTRAVVRLADPRRYAVPAVLICPEFTPAEIRELMSQGELPELAKIRNLSLVDIDSGHWPMITGRRNSHASSTRPPRSPERAGRRQRGAGHRAIPAAPQPRGRRPAEGPSLRLALHGRDPPGHHAA